MYCLCEDLPLSSFPSIGSWEANSKASSSYPEDEEDGVIDGREGRRLRKGCERRDMGNQELTGYATTRKGRLSLGGWMVPLLIVCVMHIFSGWRMMGFMLVNASFASEQLETMYCGHYNCYEVLDVDRSVSMADLKKAYRRLSLKYHPDKNTSPGALDNWRRMAKAYKVLSDVEIRGAYDFYLDHPDDLFALYYGIRAIYPSKTNPALVIVLVLLFVSLGQYVNSSYRYTLTLSQLRQAPQFKRAVAVEMEEIYGSKMKKINSKEQEEARAEIERRILLERVEVNDNTCTEKIKMVDLVAVKVFLLPWNALQYISWHLRWFYRFHIMREEFGYEEKSYLTYKYAKMPLHRWNRLAQKEKDELLERKLWIPENRENYHRDIDEEEREKRINSTKYRQWKRWKKRNPDTSYMMDE